MSVLNHDRPLRWRDRLIARLRPRLGRREGEGVSRGGWCAAIVGAALLATPLPPDRAANLRSACIDRFDAAVDYFPDKALVEDATNFTVEYHRSYKVVTVKVPYAGGNPERYLLLQCGAPTPRLANDDGAIQLVPVPITSLYAASATHVALLADLDRLDVLTGVARLTDMAGERLRERIASGRVREFAAASTVDAELVVAARPSIFMHAGSLNATHGVIRRAGIPVVANSEWLEPRALGRAEWLKFIGLFLNEERTAQSLYGATKQRYKETSAKATASAPDTWPLVMTGGGVRGTFAIAGGRSYVASLIGDAGGRYVWAENTAAGAPMIDLELQIARAANADIWINGGPWPSLEAMLAEEPRYAAFKAFQIGQVWQYMRRLTPAGSNDYWTRSVGHPDLVLADLAKIFHPALMRQHELEWYIQVPRR